MYKALIGLAILVALALYPQVGAARGLIQWDPSESHVGGKQHDARLDSPVAFWGAGVPLADVFAQLRVQTGVQVKFRPAASHEERICITLYLNTKQAPSLRGVLAQISWVLDCPFAYEVEDGVPVYYLLSSAVGAGAAERLRREAYDLQQASLTKNVERSEEMRLEALAKFGELRDAMSLSRKELISRYRGVDDLVLLALLDPSRRAFSQLLLSLSQGELNLDGTWDKRGHPWRELTAEQRQLLAEAMQPELAKVVHRQLTAAKQTEWSDLDWQDDLPLMVALNFHRDGCFWLIVRPELGVERAQVPAGGILCHVQLLPSEDPTSYSDEASTAELARLLADTPTDAPDFRQPARSRELRANAEQRVAQQPPVSSGCHATLSVIELPGLDSLGFSLWQLQEAVAKASGLHVVSDCFWQPARGPSPRARPLATLSAPRSTALDLLESACSATADWSAFWTSNDPYDWGRALDWEWGDTDGFLRFRSNQRALLRDALLPAGVLAALDSWLEPYLPRPKASEKPTREVLVPLDPATCSRVLGQLRPAQLYWGGRLIYGNSADWRNAYRLVFRERLLSMLGARQAPDPRAPAPIVTSRMLSRMSNEQWWQLSSSGLVWGVDFQYEPDPGDTLLPAALPYQAGHVFRLSPVEPAEVSPVWRVHGAQSWLRLGVSGGHSLHAAVPEVFLPLEISVKPSAPGLQAHAEQVVPSTPKH